MYCIKNIKSLRLLKKISVFILVTVWLLTGWPGLQLVNLSLRVQDVNSASGELILLWDSATYGSVPSGWDCISCDAGDPYLNIYPRGATSYSASTAGSATHQHTPTYVSTSAPSATAQYDSGKTTVAIPADTHTHGTPTLLTADPASNDPSNRTLLFIRSIGTPTQIPANTIGLFDTTSLPSGWTTYSLEDGYFVKGGSTVGAGGSNTHVHSVSVTTGTASGTQLHRGGSATGESTTHSHSGTGNSQSSDNQPTYIEVVLGRATSNTSIPGGLIAMFDASAPSGWTSISGSGGALNGYFIKGNSSAYGSTSGTANHTQPNSGIVVNATTNTTTTADIVPLTVGADVGHTHTITVSFDNQTHLPVYRDTVFAKKDATAIFTQNDFRFYEDEATVTLTNLWGSAFTGDNEDITVIPAQNNPPSPGEQIRLQINVTVSGANLSATTQAFKLQYKMGTDQDCSTGSWTDIGAKSGTTTAWRLYDNTSLGDTTTEAIQISTSDVAGGYSELVTSATNPNAVNIGQDMEWDWPIESYSGQVAEATSYSFRMIQSDNTAISYSAGDCPTIETEPGTANMMRHGSVFVDSLEKGFFWVE